MLDCNYSETWIDYLKENPDSSVSIQGSSLKEQKSKVCQLGGFFAHNCLKFLLKRPKEGFYKPEEQELCYHGSLFHTKNWTNLSFFFKDWAHLNQNVKYKFQKLQGECSEYVG